MLEPKDHHLGACNQSEITFLQIADEQEVVTTIAFPHLRRHSSISY